MMSFRRNSDAERDLKKWLDSNRVPLLASGIPLLVLDNYSNWHYFLEHGYFTPVGSAMPIVDVDRMPIEQSTLLFDLLESDSRFEQTHTLNRLRFLLKRGKHAVHFGLNEGDKR